MLEILRNMKIRASLLLGYGVTIVVSLALLIVSIYRTNVVRDDYSYLLDGVVEANLQLASARLNANIAARNLRDILLVPDDPDNTQLKNRAEEAIKEMSAAQTTLKSVWPEGVDTSVLNTYLSAASKWEGIAENILSQYDQYCLTGSQLYISNAIQRVLDECTPALNSMASYAAELDNSLTNYQNAQVKETDRQITVAMVGLLAATGVATAIVLGYALYSIRNVIRPVREVEHALQGFSEGDFDIEVNYQSKNELGNMARSLRNSQHILKEVVGDVSYLLNEMSKGNFNLEFKDESIYHGGLVPMRESIREINYKLSDALTQITMSAEQVAAGSDQVSTGAQALAQGTTEQASAVEQLSATISEIAAKAQENAQGSEDAMEKTAYASSHLDESARNMDDMVTAMGHISASSEEIGKIIATIENIAFQTNILALNAAVEAARAGSAGKGFAVVADEVRNLANKSDEAAKATKELIDRSINAVKEGNGIVGKVSDSLNETVKATEALKCSIDSIAKAVEAEAEAISHINIGIDQISAVVQTNSSTSVESAAASEELSSQATIIKELMNRFRLRTSDNAYVAAEVQALDREQASGGPIGQTIASSRGADKY